MSVVLDSSATLAWIYSDETTEAVRQLFNSVADTGALVPALWRLEVVNSLAVPIRLAASMRSFAGRHTTIRRCSTLRPTPTRIHTHGRKRCCTATVSGSQFTTPPILSWRGGCAAACICA